MTTEEKIILHAKAYIDKLSNGINPITNKPVDKNETITDDRIVRCFEYVSAYLDELISLKKLIEENKKAYTTKKKEVVSAYAENNHSAQTITANSTKACNTCRHSKNGSCSGIGRVCSDYEKAFSFTEEQKQNWPKEMDATYFKHHNKPRK